MADHDDYDYEKTLGEGAFGKVVLVLEKSTNKKYAMKIIDLSKSSSDERDLALKESKLLQQLSHQYILSSTESFEDDGALCILTEYCNNGDLAEYLQRLDSTHLEEERLREWFRQMASALEYLHSKEIIHRDVKTPNIFLTEDWNIKLGDLGLAKVLDRPNAKAVTYCGSPYYMSPEIFNFQPYGSKSDIWALGVIVYEMSTLAKPFDAKAMNQLIFKIVHGGLPAMPTDYQPELVEVLSQMMQRDPEQRPSASDILKHPYFQGSKPAEELPPVQSIRDAGSDNNRSSRWDSVIKKGSSRHASQSGRSNVKKLLHTLTILRKREKEKQQPPEGSEEFEETLREVQSQVTGETFHVMQKIVRTIIGAKRRQSENVPEEAQSSDRKAKLQEQIDHLKDYCLRVLKNKSLYGKAYDMLAKEQDEDKLEASLMKILGPERYGLCGFQLLFLKNFQYNLEKLESGASPRK